MIIRLYQFRIKNNIETYSLNNKIPRNQIAKNINNKKNRPLEWYEPKSLNIKKNKSLNAGYYTLNARYYTLNARYYTLKYLIIFPKL